MKRFQLFFLGLLLVTARPAGAVEVVNLTDAYERALNYDATLRAAEQSFAAQKEEVDKARANFRPNLRISATRGRSATESTSLIYDRTTDYYYNTQNYSIVLKQPVFNMANFALYSQSKSLAAKSEAIFLKEQSALAVRTVEAYLNVLYAGDNLDYSRAQVDAAKEQLQQAKRRFSAGYGTITEISEAQAHYDMALAAGLENNHTLELSRRELETITGLYSETLSRLVPSRLVLAMPTPHDVEEWVGFALDNNAEIDAARHEVRIAEKQVDRNRAARYPAIDLLASRTFSESDNNYSIGSQYDTYAVSLQMSLPIYSGGYVSAAVRQASAQQREAMEKKSQQERTISSRIRKFYNGILSNIAQIRAYEQAVKSNEIALIGTRKGYAAGLRSNVDVLNAQEKLFDSKRNLAKSRYQYLLSRILLKDAAGMLTIADIGEVNSCLK